MSAEPTLGTFVPTDRLQALADTLGLVVSWCEQHDDEWSAQVLRGQLATTVEPALLRAAVEPAERVSVPVPAPDPAEAIAAVVGDLAAAHGLVGGTFLALSSVFGTVEGHGVSRPELAEVAEMVAASLREDEEVPEEPR
ncbi:hypothetical protein [Egicoccus halophilus]|uniref:Uncharacterized protein n=1 Tax=Egicoccus halophilus TaxID=1670830 RepID=A0A8J3AAE4_9ACTN|nr:hypothetical protein [Egicoccus halophilus]GGI02813.1 hypothetical protein GCM10011354_01630 [Egicoccus halophilus]